MLTEEEAKEIAAGMTKSQKSYVMRRVRRLYKEGQMPQKWIDRYKEAGIDLDPAASRDLTGQRFGRLTALYPTDKRSSSGGKVWHCRCDCGNECDVAASSLKNGHTKSCGCLRHEDLTGQRFGSLTAIRPTEKRRRGAVVWVCLCDCGNECEVGADLLKQGCTKSCGCQSKKRVRCIETDVVYSSLAEAARDVGLEQSSPISRQASGKRKTAGGYHWEYV